MPALENTRHEAFAQAVARGARVDQAYEDAGFAAGNDHGARLRTRPEVAERIGELRAGQAHLADASTEAVIAALLRLTKVAETAKSPGAIREARLALLDVYRLREDLEVDRECERADIPRRRKFRYLKGMNN
jgi:hypothetical protein